MEKNFKDKKLEAKITSSSVAGESDSKTGASTSLVTSTAYQNNRSSGPLLKQDMRYNITSHDRSYDFLLCLLLS